MGITEIARFVQAIEDLLKPQGVTFDFEGPDFGHWRTPRSRSAVGGNAVALGFARLVWEVHGVGERTHDTTAVTGRDDRLHLPCQVVDLSRI